MGKKQPIILNIVCLREINKIPSHIQYMAGTVCIACIEAESAFRIVIGGELNASFMCDTKCCS